MLYMKQCYHLKLLLYNQLLFTCILTNDVTSKDRSQKVALRICGFFENTG